MAINGLFDLLEIALRFFASGIVSEDGYHRNPHDERVHVTAKAYRLWAAKRGLKRESAVLYRGRLGGERVVLSLGLQWRPARRIGLAVAMPHGEAERKAIRSPDDATTPLQRTLAEVLRSSTEADLRSITLTNEGVSLFFAPFTEPEIVERTGLRAVGAIAAARIETGTPYR